MKSLKARLLTAVVGISIILVLLFLGEIQPLVIAFAVAAVTAFMTGEYLHANKLLKKYFISVPCILFAAVIPIVLNTGLVYPIIAVFMIVGFAMLIYNHKQINYLDFAYAMFGTLLILSFSLIKRSVGIKDYSSVFPGHGGMLDRFDSIIFTAPVMLAINQFLPFATVV